jgi:hypothetical protein
MRAVASCPVTFANLSSRAMGASAMLLMLLRKMQRFMLAALILLNLPELIAAAQPQSVHAARACPDLLVNVAGSSETERNVVCVAADYAIASLEACAILQRQPINIELSDVVRSPFGSQIFGRLDLQNDLVLLTRFEAVRPLVRETPYRSFALAEFYRSMVVHEIVHAIMNQNYRRRPSSRAAWEYPAYAIQLESLAAETRESFLFTRSANSPADSMPLNDIILGFDPYLFAARAYNHLASSQSRCAKLRDLLGGDPDFIDIIE